MSKVYCYFVSFSHDRGFGNGEIFLEHPMDTYKEIQVVEKMIQNRNNINGCVLINYKRIKRTIEKEVENA